MQFERTLVRVLVCSFAVSVLSGNAAAFEAVFKNDSATGASDATPCLCFIPGDEAAAWITSYCDGTIVGVQVFWESQFGGLGDVQEEAITLYAAGSFPDPGAVLQNAGAVPAVIQGPILSDGAFNEFRHLDAFEPSPDTPLSVPVSAGQTFIVSLKYFNENDGGAGPSTAWDDSGCKAGRNAAQTGGGWLDMCSQQIDGNWIIRAIVDCESEIIPATSEWGLTVLVLLIATAGTVCIRRLGPAAP